MTRTRPHLRMARARAQEGAAVIEAMAMSLLLIAALLLVFIVGAGFYNHAVLTTTAQNMSLTAQSIMDRGCTPSSSQAACDAASDRARSAADEILNRSARNLMRIEGLGACQPADGTGCRVAIARQQGSGQTVLPDGQALATPGWGYTDVQINARFFPLGGSAGNTLGTWPIGSLTISTGSLTATYRNPNPGA